MNAVRMHWVMSHSICTLTTATMEVMAAAIQAMPAVGKAVLVVIEV